VRHISWYHVIRSANYAQESAGLLTRLVTPMARTKGTVRHRRRTRGEGTIYEKVRQWKTKGGETRSKRSWVCAISEGYTSDKGLTRRKRRFFCGPTVSAVRMARDRYLAEAGRATPQVEERDTPSVAQYSERFVEHAKANTRATTARSYEQVLRLHIEPYIGSVRLTELTRERILDVYDQVKRKVSASMAARVHVTLRAMLNLALEERVIESSPLASIRKAAPRYKPPKVEALSRSQALAVLREAKGHRLEALFVVAFSTGMRQGELFALRWSDIDLTKRTLSVVRSAQEVNGEITFVDPKTEASRRRIALSRLAVSALRSRQRIAAGECHESELVFPSEYGYPLRKSNFIRRVWEPIRCAAAIGMVRFHILRHTAASLLLAEGIHPKVVSEMLGHSSVRITLDTYSHLVPTLQAGAADAFDRVLG
jgi:integrase